MKSILEVPSHCPKCGWWGTVYDCEPDIDGDGGLGCPRCSAIIDIVTKSPHPMQPAETDSTGVLRFKANAIIRYLLDNGPFNLTDLANMRFDIDDWSQFMQLIGYSLSGYLDLSSVSHESRERIELLYADREPGKE